MTCIAPPELTDLELIQYLNKEADAMVGSHLVRCPHCRDRAIQLATEQNALRVALYRASCPDSDTLRDYHFGFLTGKETGAVEEHLHLCPHCTQHIIALRAFLADIESAEEERAEAAGPLQRIRWLVAELAGGDRLAPAVAGIRGDDDGRLLTFEVAGLRIDLNLLVDPHLPERRVIVGSLLGPAIDAADGVAVWTADLWSGQRWAGTDTVDDLGSFRFSDLLPGRYELILNGPDSKIRVPEFAVR